MLFSGDPGVQLPQRLHPAAISNTSCWLCMFLNQPSDLRQLVVVILDNEIQAPTKLGTACCFVQAAAEHVVTWRAKGHRRRAQKRKKLSIYLDMHGTAALAEWHARQY